MQRQHTLCYIGLGSNLDNPLSQVQQGILKLAHITKTRLLATSRFYRSAPMGPQDQPDFINAAVLLSTGLEALPLLHALQSIEQQQGRQRQLHWGPRTLDLDLLLYGDTIIQSPELQIPHPGISQRDFVIKPLLDLAPELVLPDGLPLKNYLPKTQLCESLPL